MAADYIIITKINRPNLGNQAIRAANLTLELSQLIQALNDGGGHMVNAADYTVLEAQFGLAAGQGANFSNLLGLINTIFNTNTDVLGATRLSQLKEFTSRLAGQ